MGWFADVDIVVPEYTAKETTPALDLKKTSPWVHQEKGRSHFFRCEYADIPDFFCWIQEKTI